MMKKILRTLAGWLNHSQNIFGIWFFVILTWMVTRGFIIRKFPQSSFIPYVDTIIGLSMFLLIACLGFSFIKEKEASLFIVPLRGVPATVVGILMVAAGLIFFIWFLVARIFI